MAVVLSSARSAVTMRLIRIGYWASDDDVSLPDVRQFVDEASPSQDREAVTDYLSRGFVARAYLGKSNCRTVDSLSVRVSSRTACTCGPKGWALRRGSRRTSAGNCA